MSPAMSSSSRENSSTELDQEQKQLITAVGVGFGIAFLLGIIAALIICIWFRRKRAEQEEETEIVDNTEAVNSGRPELPQRQLPNTGINFVGPTSPSSIQRLPRNEPHDKEYNYPREPASPAFNFQGESSRLTSGSQPTSPRAVHTHISDHSASIHDRPMNSPATVNPNYKSYSASPTPFHTKRDYNTFQSVVPSQPHSDHRSITKKMSSDYDRLPPTRLFEYDNNQLCSSGLHESRTHESPYDRVPSPVLIEARCNQPLSSSSHDSPYDRLPSPLPRACHDEQHPSSRSQESPYDRLPGPVPCKTHCDHQPSSRSHDSPYDRLPCPLPHACQAEQHPSSRSQESPYDRLPSQVPCDTHDDHQPSSKSDVSLYDHLPRSKAFASNYDQLPSPGPLESPNNRIPSPNLPRHNLDHSSLTKMHSSDYDHLPSVVRSIHPAYVHQEASTMGNASDPPTPAPVPRRRLPSNPNVALFKSPFLVKGQEGPKDASAYHQQHHNHISEAVTKSNQEPEPIYGNLKVPVETETIIESDEEQEPLYANAAEVKKTYRSHS